MRGLGKDLEVPTTGKWSFLLGMESIVAGGGAGLVSSIVTCPLDVVKTKLQAQGRLVNSTTTSYRGLLGSLALIWKEEGLRGCYRGLGPTILGYLPTWAIYFTVYEQSKRRLTSLPTHDHDLPEHVLAAIIAGASSTIATNPLWVIKTRFMTQRPADNYTDRYKHTLDAFSRIHAEEGFRGFYRGLVPSLMGVSHVAIQFPLYERLKTHYTLPDGSELPPSKIVIASAGSKMCASVVTYPHEVIRTRLQIVSERPVLGLTEQTTKSEGLKRRPHPGLVDTCQRIMKVDGIFGFYQGMGVNLIRTIPNSALTILTYEMLMRNLVELNRAS